MTLQEICELFPMASVRIRQIEAKALKTRCAETQRPPGWELRTLMD